MPGPKGFSTRTLQYSHDDYHSLDLLVDLMLRLIGIYIYIYCSLNIGSLWSAVKQCLSWLHVVHNATDVLTGRFIITGSGL